MSLYRSIQENRAIYQKRQLENDEEFQLNQNYEGSIYSETPLFRKNPRFNLRTVQTEKSVQLSTESQKQGSFSKFWRKGSFREPISPFTKYVVPDLVLIEIFSYLNKQELCNAMRTCRRFYDVGNHAVNWRAVDMSDKQITPEAMIAMMKRNVNLMRIADAKMLGSSDPLITAFTNSIRMNYSSRLQYLDVSRAAIDDKLLLMLLEPCSKLICLSLEGQTINEDISNCIARNSSLTRLDLAMTRGITPAGISCIAQNCKALEELNLSWCGMTSDCCDVLTKQLTQNIRKLNLSGTVSNDGMVDRFVENLAKNCPNLIDLDLSDNVGLSTNCIKIIEKGMPKLKVLSCNRCYGIDPNYYLNLKNEALCVLNVHGCVADSTLEMFKSMLSHMKVNRDFFNFTAKPTTSTSAKTCFIWGKMLYV